MLVLETCVSVCLCAQIQKTACSTKAFGLFKRHSVSLWRSCISTSSSLVNPFKNSPFFFSSQFNVHTRIVVFFFRTLCLSASEVLDPIGECSWFGFKNPENVGKPSSVARVSVFSVSGFGHEGLVTRSMEVVGY